MMSSCVQLVLHVVDSASCCNDLRSAESLFHGFLFLLYMVVIPFFFPGHTLMLLVVNCKATASVGSCRGISTLQMDLKEGVEDSSDYGVPACYDSFWR